MIAWKYLFLKKITITEWKNTLKIVNHLDFFPLDIAFVRCWYPVLVPKFYNPVTSLLISADDKSGWQGMKTVGQIRKQRGLDIPNQKDSLYKVDICFLLMLNLLATSVAKKG